MERGRGRGFDNNRGGRGRGGYESHERSDQGGRGRGSYEDRGRGRGRGNYEGGRGGGRGGGGRGSDGPSLVIPQNRQLTLQTNMYPVKITAKLQEIFHRYEVGFFTTSGLPRAILSRRLRRKIVAELANVIRIPFYYDGMSIFFSMGEVPKMAELTPSKEFYDQKPEKKMEASITVGSNNNNSIEESLLQVKLQSVRLDDEGPVVALDHNATHYTIILSDEKKKQKHIVIQLKKTEVTWNDETIAQLLNIATQYSCYVANPESIIRSNTVFHADKPLRLPESDLALFHGLFQSYRRTNRGILLNIDVSFYVAMDAFNLVDWFALRARRYKSLGEALNDQKFRDKINRELHGMEVSVNYGYGRKYKLEGLDFDKNAKNAKFNTPEKEMNIVEYMKSKYGKSVKNDTLPLLLVRPKPNSPPTWLLPEFCTFTKGQKRRVKMTIDERAAMIDLTRQDPAKRFEDIQKLEEELIANKYFQKLPCEIGGRVTVTSTVKNMVSVEFSNKRETPNDQGSWNFRGAKFKVALDKPVPWGIVYFPYVQERLGELIDLIVETASRSGLNLGQENAVNTRGDSPNDYTKALATLSNKVAFVLCVLPDDNKERHDTVKRFCDIRLGLPSKCMIFSDKLSFKPGVIANILSTINIKLGGQNWNLSSKINPPKFPKAVTCVMGLDVCHGNTAENGSTSGSGSGSSVVTLCASMNEPVNKYYPSVTFQDARREVVVEIRKMITEVLNTFKSTNNCLPTDILFYRDGVGEGMYKLVKDMEIKEMKEAFKAVYGSQTLPRLTYVIVQKRHHFRSIVVDANGNTYNPPPGSVINGEVTDKDTRNFYLYSHHALQGTARPTHYQVMEDGCEYGNNIEDVTYYLTFLHQGCTRSISIPVPVFYADQYAARVNDYYEKTDVINPRLQFRNGLLV